MWSQYFGRSFQNKDGVLALTKVVERRAKSARGNNHVYNLWKGCIGHRVYGDVVNVKRNIDDVIVIQNSLHDNTR